MTHKASALVFTLALCCAAASVAQTAVPQGGFIGNVAPPPQGTPTGGAAPSADPSVPTIRNTPQGPQGPFPAAAPDGATGRDGTPPLRQGVSPGPQEQVVSTEFQRFVQASTGQSLELFGYGYFSGSPQTFAPVERVPVPADYVIGPGDELYIRAWGTIDVDYRAVVDRNGQISIPRVGTVGVARLKASEIEPHLRDRIGKVFKGFSLNVTLGQLRSIPVFVVGQARRPGTYTVGSLSTLVNAVFASGGPSANGSMRRVQLRRGNALVTELDLYDFIVRGDKTKDARLQPGDIIVYLPAGPRVALLGATDNPAIYELASAKDTLADMLSLGGGTKATTNTSKAQLERIDPRNPRAPRSVQMVDPSTAGQTPLKDGDIVSLFAVAPQFANAVTLRGNVAEPLRYPHTTGMRLADLIPERDALVTRGYHVRKNRLVQYLEDNRADRREATRGAEGTSGLGATAIPSADTTRRVSTDALTNDVRNIVDEPNWEYATIERLNPDRITLTLIPFHLGKAVLERDPAQNLLLLPGDVVTIFSSKDIRGPQARGTRLVRVEGEVDRPGVYQLQPGETLRALLARAGGVTPQAYLYGTEFSRESTRQRQRQALQDAVRRLEATAVAAGAQKAANLGNATDAAAAARLVAAEEQSRQLAIERLRRLQPNGRIALELEPAIKGVEGLPDIPLEDGDALVIPSRPGFVFAVGAVSNDNALLWRPGRTVKNYLSLAGVTPEADEANIFVVRADGSVVHGRDRRGGFFSGNGVESLELAPGDTVVVPDLLNRETAWNAFVRGAKDWTQILSNFGLAAAAIKTLR